MINNTVLNCPLFAHIEADQLRSLLQCLGAEKFTYKKDEFILKVNEKADYVGVVVSGGCHVIQEDFWGNRTILTHAAVSDIFGEAFSCAETERLPISVIATESTEIMLLQCKRIITVCPSSCHFHTQMISNMLQILARKNIMLTEKMGHLSKRTTRAKILSFFSAKAIEMKSNQIIIPFNRQELADYLSVERSALSRELSAMKKDQLIDYTKNRFVLLK